MIEKIFEKLNKIPSWIAVVVVVLGCLVSAIPSVLNTEPLVAELNAILQSTGDIQYQATATPGFKYLVGVIVFIGNWVVFEVVAQFVFSWAVSSRYTNRGKKHFLTSARYTYGIIRLVYGLYSLLSVYAPSVFFYSADAVIFVLRTALITALYWGIRKECLNDKFVFNCYNRLFFIYFVYSGATWLLELFTTVLAEKIDVGLAIYAAVMVVIVGISALVLYFTIYKKLKKEQEEARKMIILPPINNGGGDSEIFRGYGL
ncbi:MAG: hypothetical protein J6V69_04195 [Clostridia bacterium]|nr:hypothetical protein [Clostridia bacterium]